MFKTIASFAAENMGKKGVISTGEKLLHCMKGGTHKSKYLRN